MFTDMRYPKLHPLVSCIPLIALLGSSCRRDVSAAELTASATPPASVNAAPPGPRIDDVAFTLSLVADGHYSSGKGGGLTLELKAKPPHHVNQEYPHKMKLKAVDGVTFPKSTLTRDSMSVQQSTLGLNVPFTPARPGEFEISGEFAFSLCTADRCLIEKRMLSTKIQVQ